MTIALLACGIITPSINSCTHSDRTNTMAQGTAIGAVSGAAIGAGIGALFGKKYIGLGSAIGGLVGGAVGYQWAKSVVKKKEAYANNEAWIRANINQLDKRITNVRRSNQSLSQQIATLKKNKQKINSSDYLALKKAANSNAGLIDTDIANAQKAMKDASGDDLARLRTQVKTLRQERATMLSNVSQLGAYSARA